MRVERVLGEPTLEVHVVVVCLVCRVDSLVVNLRIIVTHARDDKGVRESLGKPKGNSLNGLLKKRVISNARVCWV